MYEISRRDVILSAAAAAALFGLDKKVAFVGAAQAQKAPDAKGFHKFMVGDVEVFTIHDGTAGRPIEGFVKNAALDDVKAALKSAGLPDDKFTNNFTMTLVRTSGKTILIDGGTGGQLSPTAGNLQANMQAAGIDPKSINTVLVSHFHPDHIFGLMAKDTNAQIYPDAEILVPEAEYRFWTDPGVFTKVPEGVHGLAKRIQATFPTWKNIKQFQAGSQVVAGISSIDTAGHTPGHTSFVVSSGGKVLIVQGDVSNAPFLFVKNPGWHIVFDMDAAKAEAARRSLYDRALVDKSVITGYHWGMPGAGTLAKDGNGYAYTPVA